MHFGGCPSGLVLAAGGSRRCRHRRPSDWGGASDSPWTTGRWAWGRVRFAVREHVFRQDTPMGSIMVLVWEGVDQSEVGELMGDMLANPGATTSATSART